MKLQVKKPKILVVNSNNFIRGGNDSVAFEQVKVLSKNFDVHFFSSTRNSKFYTNYFFSFINLFRISFRLFLFKYEKILVHSFSGQLSNSILIIGYPSLFATQTDVFGASNLNSESASYNPNGVDAPDINEPDIEPDQ